MDVTISMYAMPLYVPLTQFFFYIILKEFAVDVISFCHCIAMILRLIIVCAVVVIRTRVFVISISVVNIIAALKRCEG